MAGFSVTYTDATVFIVASMMDVADFSDTYIGYSFSIFGIRFSRYAAELFCNGDGEIRTLDPLLAWQVLSQLSFAPFVSVSRTSTFLISYLLLLINLAATCSPMPSPA